MTNIQSQLDCAGTELRVRNYSPRTIKSYLNFLREYLAFIIKYGKIDFSQPAIVEQTRLLAGRVFPATLNFSFLGRRDPAPWRDTWVRYPTGASIIRVFRGFFKRAK